MTGAGVGVGVGAGASVLGDGLRQIQALGYGACQMRWTAGARVHTSLHEWFRGDDV